MSIVGYFKRVDKLLSYFFVTLLAVGVIVGFIRMYLTTPTFLFNIKDRLCRDATLMSPIGEIKKKEIKFSDGKLTLGASATFFVKITGKCDSNYVRVNGTYSQTSSGISYTILDTVTSNQCL
ncbi:hypothetical protein GCM10011378_36180 [Hymenobacter glacieicola]|uniref:Uncharacterized protein n=1 Tax=Hymenobacter glacieicola TaxID=1562124 RepID=A0ABQ1X3Z0_9BACT|nr:hypothetical protein GCM10011378_36180 [Hymenobacter glacieicola]